MGWGSNLLHIGEIVAGGTAIAMTGGAATPWAAGLIAGGVGGLAQDHARGEAKKEQETATGQATALNDRALAAQKDLFAPYTALGQRGSMNLASLMGGEMPASSGADSGGSGQSLSSMAAVNPNGGSFNPPGDNPDDPSNRVPQVQNPDDPAAMNLSGFVPAGARAQRGGGSVMRAPDGRMKLVPPDRVEEALKNGMVAV